jgi:hypothetical protein
MQTLSIHAGEKSDPVARASAPNLVMSSTLVVDEEISFSVTKELVFTLNFNIHSAMTSFHLWLLMQPMSMRM